jgi:hypothetical protein
MNTDYVKLVGLVAPVALVSAILYQHSYWYSFGIVIFDFLSFSALIGYSIVPFSTAVGLLFVSFLLVVLAKILPAHYSGLVLLGPMIVTGVAAYVFGVHLLWIFLPLLGAPLAAGSLDLIKMGHHVFPDAKIRFALYYSTCLVVLSGAAGGLLKAGGVMSRTDYYTLEVLRVPPSTRDSGTMRWIYLGKADDLVFLLRETDNRIVIDRIDALTPSMFTHHLRVFDTR